MLAVYLWFAYSFDLWGGSLLLLLLLLLQLLLPEHLQGGRSERLSLLQLHTCGWVDDSRLSDM